MRLEQRIGRVDRIGQRRAVHAFHLIATGTGETRMLDRLKDRIARARADIGAPDPIGAEDDRDMARLVIVGATDEDVRLEPDATDGCATGASTPLASLDETPEPDIGGVRLQPDFRTESVAEANRLTLARAWTRADDDAARVLVESDGPWVLRARRSATRASLGHRAILLWAVGCEDACGRLVESTCVPIVIPLTNWQRLRDRASVEHWLRWIGREGRALVETATADWHVAASRTVRAFVSTRLARERVIADRWSTTESGAFQPSLFDRRAERARSMATTDRQAASRRQSARINELVSSAVVTAASPRLLLVLVP